MYINTKVLKKYGIGVEKFFILQMYQQKDYAEEDSMLASFLPVNLDILEKDGFIKKLSNYKKSDPIYKWYRLDKKGKAFMREVQIVGISDLSKKLSVSLINLYESYNISIDANNNKKKVHELVAWFLGNTDFSAKEIYGKVEDYIRNTEKTYVSSLTNLIWKPPNLYAVHKNLSDSKLYGLMTNP